MTLKEYRKLLEERIVDLHDLLTDCEGGEILLTLGKISAYQMILENDLEESGGYVPKHGRE